MGTAKATERGPEPRPERDQGPVERQQVGRVVFAGLIVLTAVEFWIASITQGPLPYPALNPALAPITWLAVLAASTPLPFLGLIAVLKAGLILRYFMHVSQIWGGEKGARP